MFHLYAVLMSTLDRRLRRDEAGDVLAFLAIGAMVIAVVVFMIPGVQDLVTEVLDGIAERIGGL